MVVDQPSQVVYTDWAGNYGLRMSVDGQRQQYKLRFRREGYREQDLAISGSEFAGRDEIQLDARLREIRLLAAVAGKVIDSQAMGVAGETVYLSGPGEYRAVTTSAGEFYMPQVEAEANYELWIRPRGPFLDRSQNVRVGAAGLRTNMVLESLEYGTLSGQMKDTNSQPLPHFSMWLRSSSALGSSPCWLPATTPAIIWPTTCRQDG